MEYLINGYIALSSVMKTGSRDINRILIDKYRRVKVFNSTYHYPEKKQYEAIDNYVSAHGTVIEYLESREFESIVGNGSSGGIAAYVGDRKTKSAEEVLSGGNGFYLMIDGIEDPYNFGYVLRTAYASGCGGVFLPERNYFTSSDIVMKSSAGASELLDICIFSDVEVLVGTLKSKGVKLICTSDGNSSQSLEKTWLELPLCLVIGGEMRGINKGLMEKADATVRIDYKRSYEMSLAASSAASILIYESAKKVFSGKARENHSSEEGSFKRGKPYFKHREIKKTQGSHRK